VFPLDIDVAGQTSKPRQFVAKPKQRAEHYQRNPNSDQGFAKIIHKC
jgi:hypothetical protein